MKLSTNARMRRTAYVLLTIVMLAALFIAGAILVIDMVDMWRARVVRNEVQELYRPGASVGFPALWIGTAQAEETEPIPDAVPQALPEIHEDFARLYEKNPDIIGWLTAGDRMDLPVVQRDNAYYLNHNYFGELDSNGTVFLNERNVLYPRDQVLLIHGHNMRSGEMFGTLREYADEAYMRSHALISFRTVDEAESPYYVPVAAFDASMVPQEAGYFDITPMNFVSEEAFQDYLQQALDRSYWRSPVDATMEDQFIMLLTCSYTHVDGRFALLCRKLREGESADAMQALYDTY